MNTYVSKTKLIIYLEDVYTYYDYLNKKARQKKAFLQYLLQLRVYVKVKLFWSIKRNVLLK